MFKLAQHSYQAAALTLLASLANAHNILEFQQGDVPMEHMSQYDYSVLSFYTSDDKSKEIDALLEGTKLFLEK